MKRLVETSVGLIAIDLSDEQRFASLLRVDGDGWVVTESDWDDRDDELGVAIEALGVPATEAQRIGEQTEQEWLARGGVAPSAWRWWEWPVLASILIATVGVWLAGVGFLIWLLFGLVESG